MEWYVSGGLLSVEVLASNHPALSLSLSLGSVEMYIFSLK